MKQKERLQLREKYCLAVLVMIDRQYNRERKKWQNQLVKVQQQLIKLTV